MRADRVGHRRQAAALALGRRPLPNGMAPNADWVILEGIGHAPQLDIPLEAAQLILGFTSR